MTFLLQLLVAGAAPDVTCARNGSSPAAWIDVPTFWINLDSNRPRADLMRAQLAVALAPGTCAVRVPAVHVSAVRRLTEGSPLLRERGGALFRGAWPPDGNASSAPQPVATREIEVAVMASHLRAIHAAAATGAAAFLILEDDAILVDAELPRHTFLPPQRAALLASALARAMPAGWSLGALNVIAFKRSWQQMEAIWRAAMRDRARQSVGADSPIVAIDPTLLNGQEPAGCPLQIWGAGGYLVSASGAAQIRALWPIADAEPNGRSDSLQLDLSRVCWSFPHQSAPCKRNVPRLQRPMINLHSDVCLLYYAAAGPALDATTAATVRGSAEHLRLRRQAEARGEVLRTYVLMPPPIIQAGGQGGIGAASAMSHPETADLHRWSRHSARQAWRLLLLP